MPEYDNISEGALDTLLTELEDIVEESGDGLWEVEYSVRIIIVFRAKYNHSLPCFWCSFGLV